MESFVREVADAVAAATGVDAAEVAPLIQASKDASRGDLALACFKLAASLGRGGKDGAQAVAQELAAALPGGVVRAAEAAGPYVNLHLDPAEVARRVLTEVHAAPAYGASNVGAGKTILIDFSSPNIAKPFHLGHLRSTVIGWSLRQIHRLLGYEVVGINHLGDWGTQFGLQIAAWKRWEAEAKQRIAEGEREIEVFVDLYQRINALAAEDPSVKDEGREWFRKLEAGDPEAHELWRFFVAGSKVEFDRIYALLGITHESEAGEAFYNDKMPATIERLQASGLLTPGLTRKETAEERVRSTAARLEKARAELAELRAKLGDAAPSGKQAKKLAKLEQQASKLEPELEQARAQVPAEDDGLRPQGVDLSAEHLGFLMLLKGDGGTTYTTRDVTAAYYRAETYHPHKILYVVGETQRDHFLPWFKLIEKLGEPWAKGLVHVGFGNYANMSTRKGTAVFLEEVLEHARECARKAAEATSKKIELSDDEKEEIARAIGISAVKFFDLRAERLKDIDLVVEGPDGSKRVDLDRILSWREDPETGAAGFGRDSGPYLQFAHARLAGILRKAPQPPGAEVDFALLDNAETQALIRHLASFPGAVATAAERYEPSVISRYVLDLAARTHSWLADHNVLAPSLTPEQEAAGATPEQLSAARLLVVSCVKAVLKQALHLLGIDAREKM
ncbi:MAG: arginine--tRNA ligase [Planctomycetes bacterium]|nr:arginine--tRNA ligase [Planctomycetota bacterium]